MSREIRHLLPAVIRERVLDESKRTGRERGAAVLYACKSSSRARGFASLNSDYDVHFVYVYQPE